MKKHTDEDIELFGIADRSKKDPEIKKELTGFSKIIFDDAKKNLEEYEYARDVAADMEMSSRKDHHSEWKVYRAKHYSKL